MSESIDAIVIGGGAIGCSTAYYLSRGGCRVRLLDARKIGSECSHGNCGYVRPSNVLPLTSPDALRRVFGALFDKDAALYIRPRFDPALWSWLLRFGAHCRRDWMLKAAAARHVLLQSSMKLMRELIAEEKLDVEWDDRGLLFVYKSAAGFSDYAPTADFLQREFGMRLIPYAGEELAKFEPTLRPNLGGAWHCPTDAHLRPDRLMSALAKLLATRDVEIHEDTPVTGIDVENGLARGVQTARGTMSAKIVVVAAGAESPHFAHALGCRIPIQPGKGYSITYTRPEISPMVPMIFEETHVAVTPWQSGLRIGSTMEFVGYDRSVSRRRIELFQRAAAEHFVAPPQGPILEEWAGLRPMTYDELPRIGPAPRARNVVVAAGHGMYGISTMAATGLLASELALGMEPHIDPSPYALR